MEPKGSLRRSHKPATCPFPEPDQSSPCTQPTSLRSILILSFHLRLGLKVASFPQVSPPESCRHLSSPPYVLHAPPISFFSIWSPKLYLVRSTDHKVSCYVAFPTLCYLVLLRPNIFLSTIFSNIPSLCFFFNVSVKISHPYETTSKTIVLCTLTFTFLALYWNILDNNSKISKLHSWRNSEEVKSQEFGPESFVSPPSIHQYRN